jgi:hypothetical protein
MSNLALLDEHLRTLRLPAMLANYRRIDNNNGEKVGYIRISQS